MLLGQSSLVIAGDSVHVASFAVTQTPLADHVQSCR